LALEADRLHIGDNLDILKRYGTAESVDLIYLDPPFKKNRAYHLIFRDESGRTSDAQQLAFDDSWHWGPTAEAHYRSLVVPPEEAPSPGKLSITVGSLVEAIGRTELTAYLVEMGVRLVELHRVLKRTGTLYLHCDPTASSYLRVLLDAIFGPERFMAEIVWKRTTTHSDAKRWSPDADRLLVYTKSDSFTFHPAFEPHDPGYLERDYRFREPDGRVYRLHDMASPNPRPNLMYAWNGHQPPAKGWRFSRETMGRLDREGRIWYPDSKSKRPKVKRYLDEMPGTRIGSVWSDLPNVHPWSKERLGYPTQKPLALLERIILASSDEGDVVLDPFCGCGTAMEASIAANRRWVGIDVSDQAIRVINERFMKLFGREVPTGVIAPRDVATARRLSLRKPHGRHEFEMWAINLIGGRPNPGRDRGVDGIIPFVGRRGRVQRALVSVKSGKVKPGDMRDLKGAVGRERAAVGVLVTLAGASDEMHLEATTAGEYEPGIPKLQIITVAEALAGARPVLPMYRPQELFGEIPETEVSESMTDRVADLEDQIANARRSRRRRETERLERIRESVRQVLEAEEAAQLKVATKETVDPR
jgi:site-specific DNA-methyltransferase (adenine-specific)